MGAIDEVDADHGILGAEDVCIDFPQLFTAQIIVAVAGGGLEIGVGHSVLLKCREDLLGIKIRNLIDARKLLGQSSLRLGTDGTNMVTYL